MLFDLPYDVSDAKGPNFWWDPVGLNPNKYMITNSKEETHLESEPNQGKMVISKKTLEKFKRNLVENGTSEVINIKDDTFGRKIFQSVDKYPFGGSENKGNGNITVYDFYLQPYNIKINFLDKDFKKLYSNLIRKAEIQYQEKENDESHDSEDTQSKSGSDELDVLLDDSLSYISDSESDQETNFPNLTQEKLKQIGGTVTEYSETLSILSSMKEKKLVKNNGKNKNLNIVSNYKPLNKTKIKVKLFDAESQPEPSDEQSFKQNDKNKSHLN